MAFFGIYHPLSQSEKFFFEEISKNTEHYCKDYENFLVIGDFNLVEENSNLKDFMNSCNLEMSLRNLHVLNPTVQLAFI